MMAALTHAADWPRFRGPNGTGVGEGEALPAEFGPDRNVAWKTKVPFGRSSPIVSGNRVLLTASEDGKLVTLAFDATTGRQLWRAGLSPTHHHQLYKANDAASPTPAVDGRAVYVFFPDFGVVAYGFEGKELWRQPLGPFENFYGMSSSPVVAGGVVLLLCDQLRGSFLLAVDKQTGKQRWKTERAGITIGWSVPVVHEDQVLVFGSSRVDSYYLSTGESRWWIPLNSNGSMGVPVVHVDSVIVAASGSDQPWLPSFQATASKYDKDRDGRLSAAECKAEDWFEHFGWIDANHDGTIDESEWNTARSLGVGDYGAVSIPLNGRGRLAASALRWRFKRNLPYVPAPLLYDGVLYMVKDGGIVTSLDPSSGKLLKQGRAPNAPGQYFASPVAAAGKVFLVSEEGKITVLEAGAQWKPLARNDLGEECYATPAISGGRIFFRTRGMLYAFANR
jgi:outer membrane protein assembly factor BamB